MLDQSDILDWSGTGLIYVETLCLNVGPVGLDGPIGYSWTVYIPTIPCPSFCAYFFDKIVFLTPFSSCITFILLVLQQI